MRSTVSQEASPGPFVDSRSSLSRSCMRSKASSLSALIVSQVSPVPFADVTTDATAPAPACG